MGAGNDSTNWWSLANGDNKIFEVLEYDEEAAATSAAWRRAIREHPGAYLTHRWAMIRMMLGMRGKFQPVYDEFGNFELTDNLRVTNADFDHYSITAPKDPRLPDGG